MAYEDQIYKRPDTGKYYSIVNGTAREFNDQEAAAQLAPNAQALDWGKNTAGYDPRFGGGTVGFGWNTSDFTKQVGFQAQNAALNQAAEQAAAISNAQAPAANPNAPTDFQKYFQAELAKGRAAGDILSNNPFMAGGAQGPALQAPQPATASLAGTKQPAPVAPAAPTASTYAGNSIVDYLKSTGKPTDFASRAKMAAEQGITNYKGTAEQNLQLLNKLRTSTAQAPAPGVITPGSMEKASPIITPAPAPTKTASPDAMVEGANASIAQIMAMLNPPQSEAEKTQQALLQKMTSLVGDSAKRAADQLTAEQSSGLPDLKKQFADINAQILAKSAEYKVLQTENQNKPITMNSIIGNDRAIMNAQAADIGLLQARALGLQGQVEMAQSTVDRAIDLKYQSITDQMNIYKAQLEALQPTLDKEEKQIAMAQQLLLQEREQALQDKKEQEKSVQALVIEAAKNGASQSILNQMSKATDFMSAIKIGGIYLKTQEKPELKTITDSQGNEVTGNYVNGVFTPLGTATLGNQVGTVQGLPSYDTFASNPGMTRSDRNNNPGNIKVSSTTANYPGVIGVESRPAADGGNFLIFENAQAGINAIGQLLVSGRSYQGVTAEQAIKKYNGGGAYGASDVGLNPNQDFQSQIKDPTKRNQVASLIAKAEGFSGFTQPEITTNQKVVDLILASGKFTKDQKNSLQKAINNGEDPFVLVKNQAKNIMGQTLATELDKYETARAQVVDLQSLLDQYYKAGGDTGIFKGNIEKTLNRLGNVSDPKLVEISTAIAAALQVYRNAVSGTAYSVQEGVDIASIFPGINKSEGLNKAIITGRLKAFDSAIDAKYKNTLGNVYDELKKVSVPEVVQIDQKQEAPQLSSYLDSVLNPGQAPAPQQTSSQWTGVFNGVTNWVKSLFK